MRFTVSTLHRLHRLHRYFQPAMKMNSFLYRPPDLCDLCDLNRNVRAKCSRRAILVACLLIVMRVSHRLLRWAAVRVDEIEGRRS